jgi:hypothetical protein
LLFPLVFIHFLIRLFGWPILDPPGPSLFKGSLTILDESSIPGIDRETIITVALTGCAAAVDEFAAALDASVLALEAWE